MQIYKISFEKTDKVYIGATKNTAKDRLYNHISGTKSLISKAIREYVEPSISILKETDDIEELYLFEQIYISEFNSLHPNGFNMTSGGIGVHGLNIEEFTPPGRPKAHPLLKKVPICLKLPNWIIIKLSESTESRAKIIEDALIDVYGYKKPDV